MGQNLSLSKSGKMNFVTTVSSFPNEYTVRVCIGVPSGTSKHSLDLRTHAHTHTEVEQPLTVDNRLNNNTNVLTVPTPLTSGL